MSAYDEWMISNAFDNEIVVFGRCAEVTDAMVVAFPELRRVRGHYLCPFWGRRAHWWCVAPGGEIVDPTAAQFPSKGEGAYVPWVEGSPEPTGKCMNCGEETFHGANFCCEKCESDTMESMGFTRRDADGAWSR